ncbi:MAG: Gfo/Idh/MocA family oxidoreductase [Bacteroidota bacterium]
MDKLRGVAVGTGYFSQFQYEAWNRLEDVDMVAVCSRKREKAQAICDTYGIPRAYDDFSEMLQKENPDFVDIITPPETHTQFCIQAFAQGVAVICQKPLAPTYEEAAALAKAAGEAGIRMMVHENFRFQPWHREIKKLLDKQVIGDRIHTINLRMRMGDGWPEDAYMDRQPYFREMERLLIYETGVHFIDVFRYLLGDISKVYGKLKRLNTNIRGEDFAWVQFEFNNGTLGFLDANRYNESTCQDPRFTFGTVLLEGNAGSIRLYEDGKITVQELGGKEIHHPYYFEHKNFAGDCVFFTQAHFVAQLRSGDSFETDVEGYLKNIAVLEKVYESHEKGIPLGVTE